MLNSTISEHSFGVVCPDNGWASTIHLRRRLWYRSVGSDKIYWLKRLTWNTFARKLHRTAVGSRSKYIRRRKREIRVALSTETFSQVFQNELGPWGGMTLYDHFVVQANRYFKNPRLVPRLLSLNGLQSPGNFAHHLVFSIHNCIPPAGWLSLINKYSSVNEYIAQIQLLTEVNATALTLEVKALIVQTD